MGMYNPETTISSNSHVIVRNPPLACIGEVPTRSPRAAQVGEKGEVAEGPYGKRS